MINIHLTDHEFTEFKTPIEKLNKTHCFGSSVFAVQKNEVFFYNTLSVEDGSILPEDIISLGYSDSLEALVAFLPTNIAILAPNKEVEYIPFESGKILNAQLNNGGDIAFIASDKCPGIFDFESREFSPIDKIEGEIKVISFREDNKFIALALDHKLVTLDNKYQIHGDHDVENIKDISWNPSGTWIAAVLGTKVMFFEKNCNYRTAINFDTEIVTVSWGKEKDIVAFGDVKGRIHFYYTKNREWYSKLIIPAPFVGDLYWNTPYELTYVNQRGYGRLHINNVVDSNENDMFVVESSYIYVSHWSKALKPPPLCDERLEFDSQISCLAISPDKIAVFTAEKVHIPDAQNPVVLDLPKSPVQCATFRDGKILFASGEDLYQIEGGAITQLENKQGFVSFLTPNYTIFDCELIVPANGSKTIKLNDPVYAFTDNDGKRVAQYRNGNLSQDEQHVVDNCYSYLAADKLLAYTHNVNRFTVQYGDASHERQIENYAHVLYFSRKLYSIVTQMQRGNIETNAPHVILESQVKDLIAKHNYTDTLFISKRYQVPFSRIIRLGEVSIPELLNQIQDSKLRSFISVLVCIPQKHDSPPRNEEEQKERDREIDECGENKRFVYKILSHLFGVEFNDKTEWDPAFAEQPLAINFYSVASICFVLLDKAVYSVAFACQMKNPQTSKAALDFLLTLFDADNLFDISMRTYDTKCIATVGHVTMREPSLYIPMIEKFNKLPRDLMIAKIHNKLGDYGTAVKYFAKCGDKYIEKAKAIALREKVYDEGLQSLIRGTPEWIEVLKRKLEQLENEKKIKEVAIHAIASNNEEVILKYINAICQAGNAELARQRVSEQNWPVILDALKKSKRREEAAYFALNYVKDLKAAGNLFLEVQKFDKAEQCGIPPEHIADVAYKSLKNKYTRAAKDAKDLHDLFDKTKVAEETHHPEASKRTGKKKEVRGLPAIISKLEALLPTQEDDDVLTRAQTFLIMAGRQDDAQELKNLYNTAARAVYPIPSLPEGQKPLVPDHLKPTFGYI